MQAGDSGSRSEKGREELAIVPWRPDGSDPIGADDPGASPSIGSRLTLGQRGVLSAYGLLACGVSAFASYAAGLARLGLVLSIALAGYVGLALVTWREWRETRDGGRD